VSADTAAKLRRAAAEHGDFAPRLDAQSEAAAVIGRRLPGLVFAQIEQLSKAGQLGAALADAIGGATEGGVEMPRALELAFAAVVQPLIQKTGETLLQLAKKWELDAASARGAAFALGAQADLLEQEGVERVLAAAAPPTVDAELEAALKPPEAEQ
jgi:hypothetical protein